MKLTPVRSILVVCTASIYRSPVTAALLSDQLERRGIRHMVSIATAGTRAVEGASPNPLAAEALWNRFEIDISNHSAQLLSDARLAQADLVIVMSEEQRRHIFYRNPRTLSRVFLLNELAGSGTTVRDPHAATVEEYDVSNCSIAALIERSMPVILQKVGLEEERAAALFRDEVGRYEPTAGTFREEHP